MSSIGAAEQHARFAMRVPSETRGPIPLQHQVLTASSAMVAVLALLLLVVDATAAHLLLL